VKVGHRNGPARATAGTLEGEAGVMDGPRTGIRRAIRQHRREECIMCCRSSRGKCGMFRTWLGNKAAVNICGCWRVQGRCDWAAYGPLLFGWSKTVIRDIRFSSYQFIRINKVIMCTN